MRLFQSSLHRTLAGALLAALTAATPALASRSTLAITYGEGKSTHVDMMGAAPRPGPMGKAEVRRSAGRTRVRLQMEALPHPQSLGSFYTTYLLWAVAPEGQAASLAELPHSKAFDVDVTTPFQTFGLIVTAEPHSAVGLPSPLIVAENVARDDTEGGFHSSRLEYGGAVGALYEARSDGRSDYRTPLLVLGARHAVDLARDAGAERYAVKDLDLAERELAGLDGTLARGRRLARDQESVAREVMRIAERARATAIDEREKDRLASERRAASMQIARAQTEAGQARERAEAAAGRADLEEQRAAEARSEAERAKAAEAQARAGQEVALAAAEQARQEAGDARRAREELQQQLYLSLSSILETRREARGLIVNLSDVLFDFDRATLTPGAREKLSKLAGILLGYPGGYRLEFEGHTDSVGSDGYNQALSVGRAESVRNFLMLAGVPADRIGTATGFGAGRPVASNATSAGRQLNRRVEIVIADVAT